jgi:NNP family nitrate/nitrite transporter-like MFS transporter
MNNSVGNYFSDKFDMSETTSLWVVGLFGVTNLFARSVGGILSDRMGMEYKITGRILSHSAILLIQGLLLVTFSQTDNQITALIMLVAMSCFMQASEGLCFGVVPFVQPRAFGTVAGIVSAGGSFGAMVYSALFISLDSVHARSIGYETIGLFTIFTALFLTPFINIRGHTFMGKQRGTAISHTPVRIRDVAQYEPHR